MSQRARRVAQVIKEEISDLLQRGAIKDPRIGFVTITDVEVSKDLRYAKVFVSVYGDETEIQNTMEGLNAAAGFVRREVGKHLRLRHTPEIIFKFDQSVQYGARINEVLQELKRKERLVEDDEQFKGDC
ncbi:ribosome-binding factor A [Anoxybacter fermentans]|uniref:Ribosome-binding factor A n=1 Tax=Anoxybacter fermentans TaxID=1323375 RepID=A0A3Q9HP80_9FIRM|nr:30S ribosome-binding factor RbfA [Anoxybacter fermentans]AZR72394.1 ribosome-binding factor A [Anoxybacter fermentans]